MEWLRRVPRTTALLLLLYMISLIQSQAYGRQPLHIRPQQCFNNVGASGTCMFVWECIKTEGKHLGTCADGFLFGSCCAHNDSNNNIFPSVQGDTITESHKSPAFSVSTTTASKSSTSHSLYTKYHSSTTVKPQSSFSVTSVSHHTKPHPRPPYSKPSSTTFKPILARPTFKPSSTTLKPEVIRTTSKSSITYSPDFRPTSTLKPIFRPTSTTFKPVFRPTSKPTSTTFKPVLRPKPTSTTFKPVFRPPPKPTSNTFKPAFRPTSKPATTTYKPTFIRSTFKPSSTTLKEIVTRLTSMPSSITYKPAFMKPTSKTSTVTESVTSVYQPMHSDSVSNPAYFTSAIRPTNYPSTKTTTKKYGYSSTTQSWIYPTSYQPSYVSTKQPSFPSKSSTTHRPSVWTSKYPYFRPSWRPSSKPGSTYKPILVTSTPNPFIYTYSTNNYTSRPSFTPFTAKVSHSTPVQSSTLSRTTLKFTLPLLDTTTSSYKPDIIVTKNTWKPMTSSTQSMFSYTSTTPTTSTTSSSRPFSTTSTSRPFSTTLKEHSSPSSTVSSEDSRPFSTASSSRPFSTALSEYSRPVSTTSSGYSRPVSTTSSGYSRPVSTTSSGYSRPFTASSAHSQSFSTTHSWFQPFLNKSTTSSTTLFSPSQENSVFFPDSSASGTYTTLVPHPFDQTFAKDSTTHFSTGKPLDPIPTLPTKTTTPLPVTPCGTPVRYSQKKVVGGKNSEFGSWPWQASVRRTSFFGFSSTHRCGGALISREWVATAGHCVDDLHLSQIKIRVGEYDFASAQEPHAYVERGVKKKVVHPRYNFFTYENDLALVQLEEAIDPIKHPHISPICLPPNEENLVGRNATVTGWGRLSEGGVLPSILQEVQVPIISNEKCKNMFLAAGRHEYIPDIFMCAGFEEGGRDSCQGDSGGPLQIQSEEGYWFLAGIISWGIGCAEPNMPGVCTRISKFKDWVVQQIH